MNLKEILNENSPKIRPVTKENPDGSKSTTYEVLNSDGVTVKSGLSKETANNYLRDHRDSLTKD